MPASLFRTILQCIDLTSLTGTETMSDMLDLSGIANDGIEGHHVAALCTFPKFAGYLREHLHPTIKLAAVAPGFPTEVNFHERRWSDFEEKVDEIDAVLNPKLATEGKWAEYSSQLDSLREKLPGKTLKVIIESGKLNPEQIEKAAKLVIDSGANFVKTSTGKTEIGYTASALNIICDVVKSQFEKTGKRIGIKASGGIRTYDQALEIAGIVSTKLGKDWLVPATFRIGASSLYNQLKLHGPRH